MIDIQIVNDHRSNCFLFSALSLSLVRLLVVVVVVFVEENCNFELFLLVVIASSLSHAVMNMNPINTPLSNRVSSLV